jgi:hypothetical protein
MLNDAWRADMLAVTMRASRGRIAGFDRKIPAVGLDRQFAVG